MEEGKGPSKPRGPPSLVHGGGKRAFACDERTPTCYYSHYESGFEGHCSEKATTYLNAARVLQDIEQRLPRSSLRIAKWRYVALAVHSFIINTFSRGV